MSVASKEEGVLMLGRRRDALGDMLACRKTVGVIASVTFSRQDSPSSFALYI